MYFLELFSFSSKSVKCGYYNAIDNYGICCVECYERRLRFGCVPYCEALKLDGTICANAVYRYNMYRVPLCRECSTTVENLLLNIFKFHFLPYTSIFTKYRSLISHYDSYVNVIKRFKLPRHIHSECITLPLQELLFEHDEFYEKWCNISVKINCFNLNTNIYREFDVYNTVQLEVLDLAGRKIIKFSNIPQEDIDDEARFKTLDLANYPHSNEYSKYKFYISNSF